jgi:ATP-dependent DNA helicase RecQ
VGAGEFESYDFDLHTFCQKFSLNAQDTFYSLKRLEEFGFIQLNESYFQPSKFMFILKDKKLYEFSLLNPKAEPIIKLLSRLYGGKSQTQMVRISEVEIANHLNISIEQARKQLARLEELNVIEYEPQKEKPQIIFLTPRYLPENLPISQPKWEAKKQHTLDKVEAVIDYVSQPLRCRTQMLLDYFGENYDMCGVCDNCLQKKKEAKKIAENSPDNFQKVKEILAEGAISIKFLVEKMGLENEKEHLIFIKSLVQNNVIKYLEDGRLIWNND